MARRIFVVDDEKWIADALVGILHKFGYIASAFYSAESALKEVELCSPELVITDVVMPGMSGVEMAVLLRDRHPECKVLLFSGQAATVDILEGARARGYNFELLAKPIYPRELLSRIASLSYEYSIN